MEEYYVVREKRLPTSMGWTIRFNEGELENLTGDNKDLCGKCSVEEGILIVSNDYSLEQIGSERARKNEEDYTYGVLMRGYISDSSPNIGIFMRGCDF